MKKALSVFLAVLMMFSVLSVGSIAVDDTTSSSMYTSPWHGPEGSGKPANYNQVVINFKLNGGTLKSAQIVYDLETGERTYTDPKDIVGSWVMVPADSRDMIADGEHFISLPTITAPSDKSFCGWYCSYDGSLYGSGGPYRIPAGTGGTIIEFTAQWEPADYEEDPMQKVMGILFKVFGTIIGLLFYSGDTEMGIALMEKVFGGLF
ncbi:MAG: hypothetical protein ACI4XE_04510 [Acutalibacteraceae bacterium]